MLSALAYHRSVLAVVRRVDERAWAALHGDPEGSLDDLLLRNAYRLEADVHPDVFRAGERAARALELAADVDYYQVNRAPNASYVHQAGNAVIVFQGPLLERLDEDELTAVIGHELAHRLLWQADKGGFLAVDRLLDAAAGDARTPSQYLETHRRWSLATELFADRGAYTACGDLRTTVRALLKLETGLSTADPDAYLRQAEALDLSSGSRGTSHPEAVGRAWALKNWLAGEDVEALVTGPLDVDAPDLLDAALLRELSRDFAGAIALTEGLRTDAIATAAATFSDGLGAAGGEVRFDEPLAVRPVDGAPLPRRRPLAPSTMRYLCYLLLDLATADPEVGDDGLIASLAVARRSGLSGYVDIADDELGWSDKQRARFVQAAAEVAG
ncbi:M48 family metalloprotease [Kribbella jejuensis]|uniref:Peptidase M48-like protein n=1 Tax=Kribbella jejuensis TaxID=236068 RepID=A0A542ET70_9ACTN|nr:M48 family metalloprotease [Kribbella jejuensis]TQJ18553.1 peptidase M48-like protein [Kribbella jejuensis]